MAHWYDEKTGKRVKRVLNATQTALRGRDVFRDPTKTDAKKHGYLPGWTAIGGMLEKPKLNEWKWRIKRDVIDKHLSLRDGEMERDRLNRLTVETRAEFWRRVEAEARHEREQYAELGKRVHWLIECFLGGDLPLGDNAQEKGCLQGFLEWREKNVKELIAIEQTFCSPEWGYGGTIDIQYWDFQDRFCITDYKTKRTRPGEKIVQYYENKRQLVAYALGIERIRYENRVVRARPNYVLKRNYAESASELHLLTPILGNLYLSTTEPGRWEYIEVDPKEIPELILDARDLTRLWRRENGFKEM